MMNFFDRKIKSLQLLYRASEYQFSIAKFHQKCDEVANTIVLVRTSFQKKIGGFTPLIWKSNGRINVKSNGNESFLFSVSNKEKLKLKQGNKSQIYCYFGYGPSFGDGSDIIIFDTSNLNITSHAKIGNSYVHQNYPKGQPHSFKRFSGGQTAYFSTIEWQVWKVEFQE